jgi:hypothetical protein
MVFEVISNPGFQARTGFTNAQFKKLDDLYCRAAAAKVITQRTVDCDFEEGVARYTYFKTDSREPLLQFVISKVGPRTMMYEVYAQGRGRIAKSGVFEGAYDRIKAEIEALL